VESQILLYHGKEEFPCKAQHWRGEVHHNFNDPLFSRRKLFYSTVEWKNQSLKDEEGYYFIDRDGEYFAPLLSFLRTGHFSVLRA
jgi:hypothetical protein